MVRYSSDPQPNVGRPRRSSSVGEKDLTSVNEQLAAATAAAVADEGPTVAPPASCPLSAIHHLSHNGPIRIDNLGSRKQMSDKLHERTKVRTSDFLFMNQLTG